MRGKMLHLVGALNRKMVNCKHGRAQNGRTENPVWGKGDKSVKTANLLGRFKMVNRAGGYGNVAMGA